MSINVISFIYYVMYGDVIVRNPNGIDRDGQLMEKQAGGKQKEGDSDGERTSSSSSFVDERSGGHW